MADIVEFVTVDKNGWLHIPVDPDSDGYTEMVVEKLEVELDVMWSTVSHANPLTISPFIPYHARFDYDVYLKLHNESQFDKRRYSITRIM